MNISDISNIFSEFSSPELNGKIAKNAGVETKLGSNILSEALPKLLGAMGENTKTSQGAEGLIETLTKKHTGDIFSSGNINANDGEKILGHILGGKQNQVISEIAQNLKIGEGETSEVLKNIAPVLMGALGKANKDGIINTGNIGDILNSAAGGNTITSLLDKDGDGDIKDDILHMGINFLKNKFLKK